MLLQTTYANPGPTPMTCFACHGDPTHAAFTEFPLFSDQPRRNFQESARQVEIENPPISPLLLKPLSLAAGGVVHAGGEQFLNSQTSQYQTILNWVLDAKNSTIGATVSKSIPHPNPFRFFTDIVYFLTTEAKKVDLSVFAFDGKEIRKYEGTTNVGANRVRWDGRDKDNEPLQTGVYFYTVVAEFDDGTVVHKGQVVFTP